MNAISSLLMFATLGGFYCMANEYLDPRKKYAPFVTRYASAFFAGVLVGAILWALSHGLLLALREYTRWVFAT